MDEILKKIVEAFEGQIKITEALVAELKKTIEGVKVPPPAKRARKEKEEPAATVASVVEKDIANGAAPALQTNQTVRELVDAEKKEEPKLLLVQDVTIEQIRELSTTFSDSKNYGMDAWLQLAQKVTGQKKVKDIPKEMYGVFYGAMKDELTKLAKDRAPLSKPSLPAPTPAVAAPPVIHTNGVTIEQLKDKAKVFMDANGQPALVALVKAFGATKISEIAKEKYPAFMEAISNA